MFPLWYLLVPYGIFLGLAGLSVFFNVFHIWSFGLQSLKTSLILLVYVFSFVAIIWMSFTVLVDVPWDQNVDIRTVISIPSFTGASSHNNDL